MKFKLNPKQIMLIIMSVLLLTVIILTCVVIGKISSLFQSSETPKNTTPTRVTEPSDPLSTKPSSGDSTEPSSEPATETPTIPGHEHDYVKTETIKPTCTSQGFSLYSCSCGQIATRDFLDPKGHNFGPGEHFDATDEEPAYTLLTCLRCGETERQYDQEHVHDYQFTQSFAGNCTEDAYDEFVCTLCNDIKKENLIPAPGHDFSGWSPAEGEPGKEKRICVVCLETEYRDMVDEGTPQITTYQNKDDPDWTHHIILVKYPISGRNVTYDIWIGLDNRNITFDYSENGLMVLYTVAGQTQTYNLPAKTSSVMTVYADGTCVDYAPGNEPTEPSNPTDPTDPSVPSVT